MLRFAALALVLTCSAQDSVHFGSIAGQATDQTGAVISGATVRVQHGETNYGGTDLTDSEGRFGFASLRVGAYEVRVTHAGFAPVSSRVILSAGSAYDLPIVLRVAASEESITVMETGILEAARTQVSGIVPSDEIHRLPLNGRNVLDAALVVPGVSPTNTGSNQLFAETSAVPGQGISVGSQRNFSNNFVVDGLSANDDAAGLSGTLPGLEVISEMQVVTSGGQAEFGRALGGFVSVVTKSGSNRVYGDAYGYFRSSHWNAANALSRTVLPLTQSQYGASLGGPLRRNRTFLFGNFEQRLLNQSGLITIAPANGAAINARLDAIGYQGPRIATGQYSNPTHLWTAFGRLDHKFGDRDQLTLRYSTYDVSARNQRGAGALNAASASSHLDNRDHTFAAGYVRNISDTVLNELRGQFVHSDLSAPPSDPMGPAVSISGVANFGRLSSSPVGRFNTLYEATDNVSFYAGAHSLRVGGNFLYNDNTILFPRTVRGGYSFSSLANFLTGTYNNQGFAQTFGSTSVSQTNPNVGFYADEKWRVHRKLTLTIGARYDLQFLQTIATDRNNVSPRAGFAWTPFASRKMVVRGSFGMFYDRVPLRALANALLSAGNSTDAALLRQVNVTLSPTQAGAPVFPSILSSAVLPPGVLFNFTTMQPNMQNAYSQQGSLEIEQQVGSKATVSIGYQHLRGLHLIATVNQNVPTCPASGTNNGCRPNPNFANNSRYSSLADSYYDGLHVSFLQRPTRWGSYRVSYTYSKALNNVGEFFFSQPIDHYNIWRDYGRSDDDQRHRIAVDGSVDARWFQISGMFQYYSALPLNITTGTNTVQGTVARPTVNGVFINRNAATGFDFVNLNVRASRRFRVNDQLSFETIVESFNSLNRVNGLTKNGVVTSPTFGQTTAVQDPRSFQVALRITTGGR